ncbi:spermidine synthase [Austwickia sp. TVS 96-490-7B]|uniref:spermidine synthase n=1 Tax=Austwickia sp. TVS 96-490-7B TaxID=2830843 RepID=UPI001C56B9D0|nr:fused MFS/spermidine synthase [Austwickia sp. TVS 96-490-7B]
MPDSTPDEDNLGQIVHSPDGVTVWRDGRHQSFVDPDDPTHLAFEYIAQMGLAVDTMLPPGRITATHIGGAGLTLPRYVEHTRPGSPQIVLEPDQQLTDQVRRTLPLPRGHRIRVRAQTGQVGVPLLADNSADLIVLDAYDGGRVPADLGTVDFFGHLARVLRPAGVLVANIADEPARRYLGRVTAGACAAGLPHLAIIATHDVLKGRRFGNTVLVASASPYDVDDLRRAITRCPHPSGVRAGADLDRWVRGARPFTTEDAEPSPEPPATGTWRTR